MSFWHYWWAFVLLRLGRALPGGSKFRAHLRAVARGGVGVADVANSQGW